MKADTIAVLHVDPDQEFAARSRRFLHGQDDRFAVETAPGADAGLEMLDDWRPDCVVAEYGLPGMDGPAFLAAVRERYHALPFLVYTGQDIEALPGDALAGAGTDYLQKRAGVEQHRLLAYRIENAVESRRAAQRAERQAELSQQTEFAMETGGFELDKERGTVALTAGSARLIGRPKTRQLSLAEATALWHEDDQDRIQNTPRMACETGEKQADRWRLTPDEGDQRLLDITITPVSENGEVTRLCGSATAVAQRHEARSELEKYQTVIEALSDAVYVLDEEGRFTFVNEEFVELVGYDRETILGNTPSLIKRDAAVDRAEQKLGRLLSSDGPDSGTFEVRVEPRTGGSIVCEDHIGVLPYTGEQFQGSVGSLRDITHQKAREERIGRLQNQYQTLVENFPDGGVFLFDTEFEYVRAGGRELAAVGLTPQAIKGTSPHDLFPADIADETVRYYTETLDGRCQEFEQEYGGEHYRIQTAPVRNAAEEITHGMAVSQNITAHVERQERLVRQNERLEEFASIVSHELQNPLMVADGHLELARETHGSDRLEKAADAISRAQRLIEDLLTLAREGGSVAEGDPVDLGEIAAESWQTAETGTASIDIEAGKTAYADRSRLQQLFENLYRNAVQHGGEDVTVSVGVLESGFYVADTGSGIPEADRDAVVEAGYSTHEEGSGLGLRIVEQIADAHGWAIAVTESEQGGARFEIAGVDFADR